MPLTLGRRQLTMLSWRNRWDLEKNEKSHEILKTGERTKGA